MQPEISSVMRSDARRDLILVVSSGGTCAWGGNSSEHCRTACFPHGEALNYIKDRGNEEDAESAGGEHAADHGGAHDLASDGTCAAGGPERDAAENEGEGGHEDGAEAQASAFQSRIDERLALLVFVLGKFDDKNRVFGGEADEHDEADLRVHVVFDLYHVGGKKCREQSPAEPENEESAENCHGSAEKDAEGQRPAFIERGENQKDEEERKAENGRSRNALLGFFLLEGHAQVVVAHFAGHGLVEDLFHRGHSLAGAVTGSGGAVDLGGAVLVVAHGEFRAGARLEFCDGSEGNHFALGVFDEELADIFGASAISAFRFDVHLPLAAEAIEIVNEKAAHEGLKSLVDVFDGDTLLDDFVAVHVDELLRNTGKEGGADVGDFRAFAGGGKKFVQVVGEKFDVVAGAVFEDEGEAAGSADAGNGGRGERESDAFGNFAEFAVNVLFDLLELFIAGFAVVPGLEGDEEKAVVASTDKTEQAEADDAGGVLDARSVSEDVFDFARDFVGALHRSGVWQLQIDVEIALVFIGKKAGRDLNAEKAGGGSEEHEEYESDGAFANEEAANANVGVRSAGKCAVKPAEKSP